MRKQRQQLLEVLLTGKAISNYQAQQITNSSSGDRVLRFIRQSPPEGYIMKQGRKDCLTYCLEYWLEPLDK